MKQRQRVLGMVVCVLYACSLPLISTASEAASAPAGIQKDTRLAVGNTTPANGHFGTGFFGDNTSDLDIRTLLHDYTIVEPGHEPGEIPHTVAVSSLDKADLPDGDCVYTITLAEGLRYNDASAITAQDYVFSLLLAASPELREIGGTPGLVEHIEGYEAYERGESDVFFGVRLLSDSVFSIRIAADAPHFYVLSQVALPPYPISVIAPGCEVADNGDGAYLRSGAQAGAMESDGYTPGVFSAEMLKSTLLDPETGYEYNPKVTSGPYQLEAYDKSSGTVVLTANPRFAGNGISASPHIERLELRPVSNDGMTNALETGSIGLMNKVASYEAMVSAQQLIIDRPDAYTSAPYLRSGLALLAFACEEGPTASLPVRKAVAMCFDKDAVAQAMTGGLARRVYGYYGLGQWMASYTFDRIDTDENNTNKQLAALDTPASIEQAERLLVEDGWVYDENGAPYQQGVRWRQEAEGLVPLSIRLAVPEENGSTTSLERALKEGMAAIGASLEVTRLPFEKMLAHYYRQTDRTYNLFFLSTNFKYPFDPYYDFHTAAEYQGTANKSGLLDDELMALGQAMRRLNPMDVDGYMDAWLRFQTRLIALQPLIPLYSGVYMDVYTTRLQGYDIQTHSSWARAVQEAWLSP